ncbi:MAG: SRPBCC family protein [Chloroflexaceae bacterium]|nr:SRPBCC family protein [Chloroflexaceae bacterium]
MKIRITRQRSIQAAPPDVTFQMLSDPKGLPYLLPRLRKAEIEESRGNSARLAIHLAIGKMLGTVQFWGRLEWVEPREITFRVQKPLPATIVWTLSPAPTPNSKEGGTHLQVTMALDLAPLLGPLVHVVPRFAVEELIRKDLDYALESVEHRLNHPPEVRFAPFRKCACSPGRRPNLRAGRWFVAWE